jgi:hypothetical protein
MIAKIAPGRVTIHLPDGGTVIVPMSLESVVARLTGMESAPKEG